MISFRLNRLVPLILPSIPVLAGPRGETFGCAGEGLLGDT